eukprot:CAMPEP_0119035126 /NCGR_PEP_ID=MMETSP1177-20130426/2092_1 /TAXON_ID=2985 /ORGANISM="Ochromonas sp, Strain CCMP1899" /LENGTH=147 /DNA_ID=CAMNT_0006993061 /DNA_START=251 /DNA_END=694 /DNA_ORIENTATION=+
MHIAGVYPELSPEDLLEPTSNPAAESGMWSYDFPDAEVPGGTVAIPGSVVITDCVDPVVMITTNKAIQVQLKEDVEMLVVVDRGDTQFNPEHFFVFRTPENTVLLQWADRVEDGYSILGRVAMCTVPWIKSMASADTGFAENDGDED